MDRTIFETLIVQLKPREIIVQKQNLSSATLKIIKNAVVNVQYTHLIPEKEFWLGQSTMDELRHAKYFPAGGEDVSDSRGNISAYF